MDPDTCVVPNNDEYESDQGEEEEEHVNDPLIPPPAMVHSTMVCRVAPQRAYQAGELMCSICSTLLGLCVSSGMMPEPGTIPVAICIQFLNKIMQASSGIQQKSMSTSANEMKQISEVVSMIQREGMVDLLLGGNQGGTRIECFGPLSHDYASDSEMASASGPQPHTTRALHDAPACILKGLDRVLMENLKCGDGIVITARGHTVYMLKSSTDESMFYIFDPLHGSVDSVDAGWRAAYNYMQYGYAKCSQVAGGLNGGDHDNMYTAMIMRGKVVVPTPATIVLSVPTPFKSPLVLGKRGPVEGDGVSKTRMRVEIMEDANRILETMRHSGGPIVQALRYRLV